MNGLRPILGPGSKLWWELRLRWLPCLVFTSVLVAAGFCWRELVTNKDFPRAAHVIQNTLSCEPTNPPLLSISQTCQVSNGVSLHLPATKPKANP